MGRSAAQLRGDLTITHELQRHESTNLITQMQRLSRAIAWVAGLQSLFAYVPFTWRACSTSEWPLEPQDRDLSRSRTERGCYFCGAPLPWKRIL